MIKIGLVIPCYNVEQYIDQCLESVFVQTNRPEQIVVVDNNSTDSTVKKLMKMQSVHPEIRIVSETKPGASSARNKGLTEIDAEWVQFLDADDLLKPTKLAHQLHLIKNAPFDADFIAASSLHITKNEETKIKHPMKDKWKGLFVTNLGNTCSNLWRKETILAINGWNENLKSSQESDLMYRLITSGYDKIIYDVKPLTIIRDRTEGQISKTNTSENLLRYYKLRKQIFLHLRMSLPEYFKKEKEFYIDNMIILAQRLFKQKSILQVKEIIEILSSEKLSVLQHAKLGGLRFQSTFL